MARQSGEDDRATLLRGTLEAMILRVLVDGPEHGYGIGASLERALGDKTPIEDGSLYPALYRLERRGWIQGTWARSDANRRARFYALTPDGRAILARRTREWSTFASAVSRLLGGGTR